MVTDSTLVELDSMCDVSGNVAVTAGHEPLGESVLCHRVVYVTRLIFGFERWGVDDNFSGTDLKACGPARDPFLSILMRTTQMV